MKFGNNILELYNKVSEVAGIDINNIEIAQIYWIVNKRY